MFFWHVICSGVIGTVCRYGLFIIRSMGWRTWKVQYAIYNYVGGYISNWHLKIFSRELVYFDLTLRFIRVKIT